MAVHDDLRTSRFETIGRLLTQVADAIGVVLFLAAFSGFIIQIFFRYVMGDPLQWTEEGVMIAFIWTIFWAAAFLVPVREHVTFDVIYDVVSDKTKRIFAIISMTAVVVAFVILIPPTLDYLDFLTRKKSPVMRIPMHWIYGCYIFFVIGFATKSAARLIRLCGPHWRASL